MSRRTAESPSTRSSARRADAAKLALLERFRAQMLATARRYSTGSHDAEDAFQRAAEILLTHSPTGTEDELCRWLRTTVKHEALALRRQRERVAPAGAPEAVPQSPGAEPDAHERAERLERLRLGAQALGRLKPQEVRCLLLRAEGYSYAEICSRTGFSYTKVNRCLAEGRRAFIERVTSIESGEECRRLAPQLSALADGEASAQDLAVLRPHLRSCQACQAQLRESHAVPARVAALLGPAALAGGSDTGAIRSALESTLGAIQHKAAALGERAAHAAELAGGQKVAAVAASAAAIAGGGAVTAEHLSERGSDRARPAARSEQPRRARVAVAPSPDPPDVPAAAPEPRVAPIRAPDEPDPAPPPSPAAETPPDPPPPPPPTAANEFDPSAASAQAAPAPAPSPAPAPAPPSGGGGGGEFAP